MLTSFPCAGVLLPSPDSPVPTPSCPSSSALSQFRPLSPAPFYVSSSFFPPLSSPSLPGLPFSQTHLLAGRFVLILSKGFSRRKVNQHSWVFLVGKAGFTVIQFGGSLSRLDFSWTAPPLSCAFLVTRGPVPLACSFFQKELTIR